MKASERRLLTLLGVVAALCGGAILTRHLLQMQHAVERKERGLQLRRMEADALLREAGLWQQRLTWLDSTQPELTSENQASEELLEGLLQAAAAHSLQVQKKQLHEPAAGVFHQDVGVTLTVRGTFSAVFRWVHAIQLPESFCAVPRLQMSADSADPNLVVVSVRFSRLLVPAQPRSPEGTSL
ncbi:hypothetical protein [Prosthecobacter sp.]|jgi:hypothetical protein|uniref:hypothetical protein n=1 Tax=Prosthecobacter sp. TaxID=1965333 RepID=UPI003785015A